MLHPVKLALHRRLGSGRMPSTQALSGCRVLVVEDEYLLAEQVAESLREFGAKVVGPIGSLADAMRQVEIGGFDIALIDLNLQGEMAFPLARALQQQGGPYVFVTGYERNAIPAEFAHVTRWEKPFSEDMLVDGLARVYGDMRSRPT